MNTISYFKERFEKLQTNTVDTHIKNMRDVAFTEFEQTGIPTVKHEEWKYTRINDFFNKDYHFTTDLQEQSFTVADLERLQLPGHEDANLIVFINGHFHPELSHTRSEELEIVPLQSAASDEKYAAIVKEHLGHSADYHKDGINALNQKGITLDRKVLADLAMNKAESFNALVAQVK